jgi:hypothetical protein
VRQPLAQPSTEYNRPQWRLSSNGHGSAMSEDYTNRIEISYHIESKQTIPFQLQWLDGSSIYKIEPYLNPSGYRLIVRYWIRRIIRICMLRPRHYSEILECQSLLLSPFSIQSLRLSLRSVRSTSTHMNHAHVRSKNKNGRTLLHPIFLTVQGKLVNCSKEV